MRFLVFAVALLLSQSHAMGQSAGDRVRIKTQHEISIGTFISVDRSSLKVRFPYNNIQSIPLAKIEKLERSLGMRSNAKKGFLVGGAIGVVVGVVNLAANWEEETPHEYIPDLDNTTTVLVSGAIAAGSGLAGLLVGAVLKSENWIDIPVPYRNSRLYIAPGTKRLSLDAGLRF
ncbi:MAG: hypothetical protein OYM47_20220 [Gemmatimonadota bacterium]|nr:hypothetical protein [Gemmatimonadota bacterium]